MSTLPFIKTFATVVRLGSFTATAQALDMSKPVVSKQISALEQHLGVQLFNRTTRRLNLTEAGETFAIFAQNIMEELEHAEQAVMPLQKEPAGQLKVTAPHSLTYSILPNVLLAFQARYPKVQISLQVSGRFVDLVDEGIDVALRTGPLEDSSLIAKSVLPFQYQVCATDDYWQRFGKPDSPSDLIHHNCLIYASSSYKGFWRFTDKNGEDFKVRVTGSLVSDEPGVLLNAAQNGLGVFYGPSYLFNSNMLINELTPVLSDFQQPDRFVHAVYPQSKHIPAKTRAFIDFCDQAFQSQSMQA